MNTINETSQNDDERRTRLICMFETKNKRKLHSVDCSISRAQYSFMMFLLQHCCPNGNAVLTDESVKAAFESDCVPCLKYIRENALNRLVWSPDCIHRTAAQRRKLHIEKYLQPRSKRYCYIELLIKNDKHDDVVALINGNPRIAWDSVYHNRNIAQFAAMYGNIALLNIVRESIINQPYDWDTRKRLLTQTFEDSFMDGRSALEIAILNRNFAAFQFIVEECCPTEFEVLSKQLTNGETLLHRAARDGVKKIIEYILCNSLDVRENLAMRAFSSDIHGTETALDVAKRMERTDIIQYLSTIDHDQLQRKRELTLVQRAQRYLNNTSDSLPEIILQVMEQEMEAQDYRARNR